MSVRTRLQALLILDHPAISAHV